MPNHIHAIVVPANNDDLKTFFGPLHHQYALRTNIKYEWRGHLWQGRFYSVVMDESHLLSAMRYVELNPVKAGLCRSAADWPWSSARGNLGIRDDPLLTGKKIKSMVSDWAQYLSAPEDENSLQRLRDATYTGRPDGSPEFLSSVEQLTGRVVRKKKPGRPVNKIG